MRGIESTTTDGFRGGTGVRRDRLLAVLHRHPGSVLVVAPAGFGKSTLLEQFAAETRGPVARIALGREHDDVEVLWRDIATATRSRAALLREPPLSGVARLSRGDGGEPPRTLVLDGIERLHDARCVELLAALLEHTGPALRTVAAGRRAPGFPTASLRVRGELLLLGSAELAFDEAERRRLDTAGAADGAGTASTASAASAWPALAALEAQSGAEGLVREFLQQEVLGAVPDAVSAMLVDASVLEVLDPVSVARVVERDDAAELLELAAQSGLLDADAAGPRLLEPLRRCCRAVLDAHPARSREAHRRAARHFDELGETGPAVAHHRYAGDGERAIESAAGGFRLARAAGRPDLAAAWLDAFDAARIAADGRLAVMHAWVLAFAGRTDDARAALDHVRAEGYPLPSPDGATSLASTEALIGASFPGGDAVEMSRAAALAFSIEDRDGSEVRSTACLLLGCSDYLVGRRDRAARELERAAALAASVGRVVEVLHAQVMRALIALEVDDLETARQWAERARDTADDDRIRPTPFAAYAGFASDAVDAAEGELDAIPRLEAGVARLRSPFVNGFTLAQCLLLLAELKHRNGRAADARLAANEALAIVEALHAPGVLGDRARRLDYVLRNGREPRPEEPLSEREIEVVRLFAAGLTKREVADRLYVSFNTVHSHAKSIYRKLGAATRDEMLDRAAAGGVL